MMDNTALGYVAGVIEGEGYISTKGKFAPAVTVQMTDIDVLQKLQKITGIGTIYFHDRQQPHHKDTGVWRCQGLGAANLLTEIRPLMGLRRKQKIDDVLSVFENRNQDLRRAEEKIQLAVDEYRLGGISLRDVARKHNTSRTTIWRRITTK